jgi:transcriptional regulator NrdR family protein
MPEIKVQKNDGQLEDFDRSKVSAGAVNSGASSEEAETIAAQVETWAQGTAVDGVIKSSDIRTKVLELLRSINPGAAATFEMYKKTV